MRGGVLGGFVVEVGGLTMMIMLVWSGLVWYGSFDIWVGRWLVGWCNEENIMKRRRGYLLRHLSHPAPSPPFRGRRRIGKKGKREKRSKQDSSKLRIGLASTAYSIQHASW